MTLRVYLIGSLRNPEVPRVAFELRKEGHEVFDDWFAAGPEADDYWQKYETERGRSYKQALAGRAATNTFRYDKGNLDRCDVAVLVAPGGKSAHLELGYVIGTGKPAFIYMPPSECRWDVMYRFATGVCESVADLKASLKAVS